MSIFSISGRNAAREFTKPPFRDKRHYSLAENHGNPTFTRRVSSTGFLALPHEQVRRLITPASDRILRGISRQEEYAYLNGYLTA